MFGLMTNRTKAKGLECSYKKNRSNAPNLVRSKQKIQTHICNGHIVICTLLLLLLLLSLLFVDTIVYLTLANMSNSNISSTSELELKPAPKDGVTAVQFANKSNLLAASSWDATVRIYDADVQDSNNSLVYTMEHKAAILDCCFDASDAKVYAGSADGSILEYVLLLHLLLLFCVCLRVHVCLSVCVCVCVCGCLYVRVCLCLSVSVFPTVCHHNKHIMSVCVCIKGKVCHLQS
jgi:WD domain, G-beta repeat